MTTATVDDSAVFRRDVRVISLIGLAHGLSHFYQLCWAPILYLAKVEFDLTFQEAGIIVGVFFGVSGVCQIAAGFVVDRVGARPVLAAGLALTAAAIGMTAGAHDKAWLYALAALGGVGNSVFHPADFAILNASVDVRRIGRAYSVHGLGGTLGWAAGPLVLFLGEAVGWRAAAMIAASVGMTVALVVAGMNGVFVDHRRKAGGAAGGGLSGSGVLAALLSPPILMCFFYFAFIATNSVGIQQFAVPALKAIYGVAQTAAALSLTAFLVATAVGIAVGGWFADSTKRHDLVAAAGLCAAAAFMVPVALGLIPGVAAAGCFALAGFSAGVTGPSRDMIVRSATPPGSTGKVFGFVYSGLDLGSTLSPAAFGMLMDRGMPSAIFWIAVGLYLLSVPTVLTIRRLGGSRGETAAA